MGLDAGGAQLGHRLVGGGLDVGRVERLGGPGGQGVGPTRARDVAGFLDAPVKEIKAHWPADATEVVVEDAPPVGRPDPRFVLADDLDALTAAVPADSPRTVRLSGGADGRGPPRAPLRSQLEVG